MGTSRGAKEDMTESLLNAADLHQLIMLSSSCDIWIEYDLWKEVKFLGRNGDAGRADSFRCVSTQFSGGQSGQSSDYGIC